MNKIEQYEFDRVGYIIIPNFLTNEKLKTAVGSDQCLGRTRSGPGRSSAG